MGVELGLRVVERRDGADAFEAFEETHQRGLARNDNLAAHRRHRGREAGELNGIAVTLLGMQQDGLTVERRPIPNRFVRVADGGTAERQARLIGFEARFVVAERQEREGAVELCLGVVGLDFQRVVIGLHRVLVPAERIERRAQIVVHLGGV